ncbi:MAG: alkaline phosphatase family protein [Streptosporangiaceae bacterium]
MPKPAARARPDSPPLAGPGLAARGPAVLVPAAAVLAAPVLAAAALAAAVLAAAVLAGAVMAAASPAAAAGRPPQPRITAVLRGSGPARLREPSAIALGRHGAVWVADRADGRLAEFSAAGRLVTVLHPSGRGALDQPQGLAVTAAGDLLVADTGHGRIVEFSPSGALLGVLTAPRSAAAGGAAAGQPGGAVSRPAGVAVTPSGRIYVADQGTGNILEFSPAGRYLTADAVPQPDGIAVTARGDILVTTAGWPDGNKVRRLTPEGRWLRPFGTTQAGYGALSDPAGIAAGPDGRIYVTQPDYGWVTVFTARGAFAGQFGLRPGTRGQSLTFPQGVAVTAAGRVWVADQGAGRVVQFAAVQVPPPAPARRPAWPWVLAAVAAAAVLAAAATALRRRRRPGAPGPGPAGAGSAPADPASSEPAQPGTAQAGQAGGSLSRRRLLHGAALLTGAAAAAGPLPASLTRALAAAGAAPPRLDLRDIGHVVILMQENRSFDHYFGTMPGIAGFADPRAMRLPDGSPVFQQPDLMHRQGYLTPFHLDTRTTSAQATPDLDHSWRTQHDAWAHGRMDGWIAAKGPFAMGYFTQADIPFHWALAQAFTICDNYHCSVLGATDPNRLYAWTGTIDPAGQAGGPVTTDAPTFSGQTSLSWTTYPERLGRAGISWQIYQEEDNYDNNPLEWFAQYQAAPPSSALYQRGLARQPAGTFEADALAGRLPQVSWLIAPAAQSEHPRYFPAAGAEYIAQKLAAIAANPQVWARTVFILTYDENDGLFDHVPPPVPPPGTPGEFVGGEPIGLGFRVPAIIVSPWTAGGRVCSQVFDHTSLLRLLETRFGVTEPNISGWRRRTCGDLTAALRAPAAPYSDHRAGLGLAAAGQALLTAQHQVSVNPPPMVPSVNEPLPRQ